MQGNDSFLSIHGKIEICAMEAHPKIMRKSVSCRQICENPLGLCVYALKKVAIGVRWWS